MSAQHAEVLPAKHEEPENHALAVNLRASSLPELAAQRTQLKEFVQAALAENVDYGIIPGTPKPSLYKPGAEKLCKLFQLGSRIVDKDRILEPANEFAMFSYTVEVFHIPTGRAVAQCEGSANSQEKKYKSRPAADQLNTLMKMAQKRALVGAVIVATGASDFFTQDIEDMPREFFEKGTPAKTPPPARAAGPSPVKPKVAAPKPAAPAPSGTLEDPLLFCESCHGEMVMAKSGKGYYCPQYLHDKEGQHSYVPIEKVAEALATQEKDAPLDWDRANPQSRMEAPRGYVK